VELNRRWGFIDRSGKFVIEPKFDDAWNFNEGLAGVELNGKWGFIDKSGKIVIEPKFDDIGY
ncbi:WG repeat-containing protein, partial [Campylobacter coli]|nr:WG repeat-containing protein [Campylobacter coli]